MAVKKLSISVPAEVEELIKVAAEAQGTTVSAWLADAAVAQARKAAREAEGRAAARELLAEIESEQGPVPPEYRTEADDFLRRLGLLDDGADLRLARPTEAGERPDAAPHRTAG
jgi:regulator of protease activity HflC (stomatin/prohibitin superfamily)